MFIVPLSQIPTVMPIEGEASANATAVAGGAGVPFVDILKDAFENMQEARGIADEDAVNIALGQMDNLHTAQINASKASIATDFTVGLVSRAMTAYNEVIRMQV